MTSQNIKFFFMTWLVVILINQIAIFGACFALYCLIAAVPHTIAISAAITYIFSKMNTSKSTADTNDIWNTKLTLESNEEIDALRKKLKES